MQTDATEEKTRIIQLFFGKMRDFNTAISFVKNMEQALPLLSGALIALIG